MPRQSYQQWYGMQASENADPQLQIIGAGFGRTGTSTMKKVFEALGFGNCYHMLENVNLQHTPLWNATMPAPQLKRILREGACVWYRRGDPFGSVFLRWQSRVRLACVRLTCGLLWG